MSGLFYKDIKTRREVSYLQLFDDICNQKIYNSYCVSSDYYVVLHRIVLSIVLGKEIVLLDEDFSEEEIYRLINTTDIEKNAEPILNINDLIPDFDSFIEKIRRPEDSWKITLFTSGTTGLPKRVSHNFSTISRSVKTSEKHQSDVWGFAYNPTHMAGIQVFFQALLNLNPIIRLFRLNNTEVFDEIAKNNITHISATPTFYRLLMPSDNICNSVCNITSGGEKFDSSTTTLLKAVFPNARITNVYASTEAGSLFASDGDLFFLKSDIKDLIMIQNNELLLHKSLMGASESLRLIDNTWYATGDLVDVISTVPIHFRFLSRKNEMINVGGYKVNPHEIEDELRKIEGITEVRVYSKPNSILGNIIIAEVVKSNASVTEPEIRILLQSKLQEYKIPRIFKFVDTIQTTRTGKIQRN